MEMASIAAICQNIGMHAPDDDTYALAEKLLKRINHAHRAVDQVRQGSDSFVTFADQRFPSFVVPFSPAEGQQWTGPSFSPNHH
jgi:hypothetical protein